MADKKDSPPEEIPAGGKKGRMSFSLPTAMYEAIGKVGRSLAARMFSQGSIVFDTKRGGFTLTAALVLALAGCGNEEPAQNDASGTNADEGRHLDLTITSTEADDETQDLTPIVASVPHAPIAFAGSDGRTHLVYELETTNFSSGETTIEQLEVLNPDSGEVVDTLDTDEVASRLQSAGFREAADALAPSMMASVFLHVTFDEAGRCLTGWFTGCHYRPKLPPPINSR